MCNVSVQKYLVFDIKSNLPHIFAVEPETSGLQLIDDQPVAQHGLRQKRATCDLLSFTKFADAACAAHCLSLRKGFRGGYCTPKKVCQCRK